MIKFFAILFKMCDFCIAEFKDATSVENSAVLDFTLLEMNEV